MQTIKITCVKDFLAHIELSSDNGVTSLYRGEAKLYDYPCTPKLYRGYKDYMPLLMLLIHQRRSVYDWINEVAILEEREPAGANSPFEQMALAQHYGISTCLLDWSLNPLVALWFACSDQAQSKSTNSCYVYSAKSDVEDLRFGSLTGSKNTDRDIALKNPFNGSNMKQKDKEGPHGEFFQDVHFVQVSLPLDSRILSQSSVFSIHPHNKVSVTEPITFEVLGKYTAPILEELSVLGINKRSLSLETRDSLAERINMERSCSPSGFDGHTPK